MPPQTTQLDESEQDLRLEVLIADDQRLLSEAVAKSLEISGEFNCEMVGSLTETSAALDRKDYDLLLLDLSMPGMMGLESVQRVVNRAKHTKVALFSTSLDRLFVEGALKIGVKGYIDKTMSIRAVISALRLISCDQAFVPANIATHLSDLSDEKSSNPLNDFETTTLSMAAQGFTNKKIAANLNSTEANIKAAMRSICRKLNASNRTQATIIAKELQLI